MALIRERFEQRGSALRLGLGQPLPHLRASSVRVAGRARTAPLILKRRDSTRPISQNRPFLSWRLKGLQKALGPGLQTVKAACGARHRRRGPAVVLMSPRRPSHRWRRPPPRHHRRSCRRRRSSRRRRRARPRRTSPSRSPRRRRRCRSRPRRRHRSPPRRPRRPRRRPRRLRTSTGERGGFRTEDDRRRQSRRGAATAAEVRVLRLHIIIRHAKRGGRREARSRDAPSSSASPIKGFTERAAMTTGAALRDASNAGARVSKAFLRPGATCAASSRLL